MTYAEWRELCAASPLKTLMYPGDVSPKDPVLATFLRRGLSVNEHAQMLRLKALKR